MQLSESDQRLLKAILIHGIMTIILIKTTPASHIDFSVIVIMKRSLLVITKRNENFSISYEFVMITIMIMTRCESSVCIE